MRVLMVSSSGGHLTQLMALRPWWEQHERTWVTFETLDATSKLAGEDVVWAHHPTTRNVKNLVRNTALAWRTMRSFRPDVIVSTGAGVAVPFFWLHRPVPLRLGLPRGVRPRRQPDPHRTAVPAVQ